MTDDRMALIDLIQQSHDGDFLRSIAELTLQRLMEFQVDDLCQRVARMCSVARPGLVA